MSARGRGGERVRISQMVSMNISNTKLSKIASFSLSVLTHMHSLAFRSQKCAPNFLALFLLQMSQARDSPIFALFKKHLEHFCASFHGSISMDVTCKAFARRNGFLRELKVFICFHDFNEVTSKEILQWQLK